MATKFSTAVLSGYMYANTNETSCECILNKLKGYITKKKLNIFPWILQYPYSITKARRIAGWSRCTSRHTAVRLRFFKLYSCSILLHFTAHLECIKSSVSPYSQTCNRARGWPPRARVDTKPSMLPNYKQTVWSCNLLLTWNASKIQLYHTARRVFTTADGHHGRAWILNLVCQQTTSGQYGPATYCSLGMHQKFSFTIQLDVYSRTRMATTRTRGY